MFLVFPFLTIFYKQRPSFLNVFSKKESFVSLITSNRCDLSIHCSFVASRYYIVMTKRIKLIFFGMVASFHLSKKQDTKLLPITSPNVNRFSNTFHWWPGSKFATNFCFNIPSRLKYVATLPCEIRMSEKWRQAKICIV